MLQRYLYIFLDESGNLDFSPNGTKYFQLCAVAKERPFLAHHELAELKYDLVEQGIELEYFHAAENKQAVRDKVFTIIQKYINGVRIHALLVEKSKTNPALRGEEQFYPRMLGYLIRFILDQYDLSQYGEVIVFTDIIPVGRKNMAVKGAVKVTLASMINKKAKYRLVHHHSKSNYDLQIADYYSWAIFRKWERGDMRSYDLIKSVVRSEYDIFRTGNSHYY